MTRMTMVNFVNFAGGFQNQSDTFKAVAFHVVGGSEAGLYKAAGFKASWHAPGQSLA